MAKYIDICIQPIPKKKLAEYRKMTKVVGQLLIKHGALASRDFVAEDENATKLSFPKRVKLKPGEVVIYAVAEFNSKAHRAKVLKAMMQDPRMQKLNMEDAPFIDPKRVIVGGFSLLVEVE